MDGVVREVNVRVLGAASWLFNVYMDGVVREVNVRVLGAAECEWRQI